MSNEAHSSKDYSKEHQFLRSHRFLSSMIGISHTFLCAGIVFGWASLLSILRTEKDHLSSEAYARVFIAGAIGNYTSNLPFGYLLDSRGPKVCGIVSSALFALALVLCWLGASTHLRSNIKDDGIVLGIGFGLLGFAGPAIQIPTLHLAKLFPSKDGDQGSDGVGAAYMSAQAAAFDGGTAIFALFAYASQLFGWKSSNFFLFYVSVPMYTMLTSFWIWPNKILPDDENISALHASTSTNSFGGSGSPFLSEHSTRRLAKKRKKQSFSSQLKDVPLSQVLSHPQLYCLACWVGIHILKLNFVVATINDQLQDNYITVDSFGASDEQMNFIHTEINLFGLMLPFGFVIMPLTAYFLQKNPMLAFQVANIFGLIYGAILTFQPQNSFLMSFVAFPIVATSRQLVYSTVFHQIGSVFGFKNFGVLLGLANVFVSVFSLIQNPLVDWAAKSNSVYFGPNLILFLMTFPLFIVVFWTNPVESITNDEIRAGSISQPTIIEKKRIFAPTKRSMDNYGTLEGEFVPLVLKGKMHSFGDFDISVSKL